MEAEQDIAPQPGMVQRRTLRRMSLCFGVGGLIVPGLLLLAACVRLSFPEGALLMAFGVFLGAELVALLTGLYPRKRRRWSVVVCAVCILISAMAGAAAVIALVMINAAALG